MPDSKLLCAQYVTFREIFGQPELWRKLPALVSQQSEALDRLFESLRKSGAREVIFTGAGSSAFVGEAVSGLFEAKSGLRCRAIATTDLVTHPQQLLSSKEPFLLVSFARSGNSPESIAAVEIANQIQPEAHHLIITCNRDGALAKLPASAKRHVFLLPPEANDQGLAMIGSVTGMILSAVLIAGRHELGKLTQEVEFLCQEGDRVLQESFRLGQALSQQPFERIVCLGSGPLLGVAREAHLKVQELSDGRVIGKFDSFLGFRHGPKAVVDDSTLMLHFRSRDPYVAAYESDLTKTVRAEARYLAMLEVEAGPASAPPAESLVLDPQVRIHDPGILLPLFLLPAQLLGALKSIQLGLNPDSPSPSGAIHRVVQGVVIYPFPGPGKA